MSRPRILVIEDDALVGAAIRRALATGYDVALATDGPNALDILKGSSFDLILSDVRMPRMSGFELHQHIAELRPELAPRVVFMSGDVGPMGVPAALLGVPLLPKPFRPPQLTQWVAAALARLGCPAP